MKQQKRTKIVCTLGPASWDVPTLKKLVKAGMNVARLNCAFVTNPIEQIKEFSEAVRSVSDKVALMLDIKGNDVRLNNFDTAIKLKKGDTLIIGNTKEDDIYPANYLDLYKDLKKGTIIFFDDGEIKAEVKKISKGKIYLTIISGELLEPGKSLNTPGTYLNLQSVTKADAEQIKVAIEDDWDFVAASYVRDVKDANLVKKHLKGSEIRIIAKIEESMGVANIDEILEIVDGVMIGRGDMGVEMPFEQVPAIQKMIIQKCNELALPVITATQVMASMKNNPLPTRAEISDAANAIWDGTDMIMTSGETTVGKYPVETVEAISKIALENEQYLQPRLMDTMYTKDNRVSAAVSNAAFEVAMSMEVDAIIVASKTGRFARFISRYDLPIPIITFVTKDIYKRQLAMTKGVDAHKLPIGCIDRGCSISKMIDYSIKNKLIKKNSKILIVGSVLHAEVEFPNIFEYVDLYKKK